MKTSFNIVYSDKRKFAYFNIAKCGSTSINKLCSEVNIDAVVNPVRGRGVVRKWNHPGIPLEKVKDYFKFTIIRDPLSRLVSCYKNKVTDILSFPLSEKKKIFKQTYIGDIVISYDFIDKPKSQDSKVFKQKLIKIFIHGFLHLLGFDHVKNKDYIKMLKVEKQIYQSVILKLK